MAVGVPDANGKYGLREKLYRTQGLGKGCQIWRSFSLHAARHIFSFPGCVRIVSCILVNINTRILGRYGFDSSICFDFAFYVQEKMVVPNLPTGGLPGSL
jgi:hypothetical protein